MLPDPSELERLTQELVNHPSVTGTTTAAAGWTVHNETLLAEWIHSWLEERGVRSVLQSLPDGRKNVFAFVRGASERTVVLMGHFDTVPPSPGQALAGAAAGEHAYLFGRGSLDMKSGVAVVMSLMAGWAKAERKPAVSILFVATCDEEVESSGVLRAIGLISAMKGGASAAADRDAADRLTGGLTCDFLGVLNVDYTTERFPGDGDYHAWEGTIGKVLAGVYVRGYQTHAGEYFRGFHAMGLLSRLVTAIDGNNELAGKAPPPVTLKVADAKEEYNVMTSPAGRAYFNIFTTGKTPAQLLRELRGISDAVIARYLEDLNRNFTAWGEAAGVPAGGLMWEVSTITWSELRRLALERAGAEKVQAALDAVRDDMKRGDVRDAGFAMIAALLDLVDNRDPVVVLAFLPPFYPYISPDGGSFGAMVRKAVAACRPPNGRGLTLERFYPYISDMSYLRIEPEIRKSLDGLTCEMPGWGEIYSLDFDTIGRVDLPVVNIGPYGFGAHQPEERVEREYSFGVFPGLVSGIVESL
jgi:arginine utilization protein RocB